MAPREEPESVYPSRKGELNAGSGSIARLSERMPRPPARRDSQDARGRPPIGWARGAPHLHLLRRGQHGQVDGRARRARHPQPTRRRASACSGRSRARPRSATTCSTCCSRTTASSLDYDECDRRQLRRRARRPRCRRSPRSSSASRRSRTRCDAVVIIGSDYTDVGSPTELGYNARIAANLGAPVLLVLGGRVGQGAGRPSASGTPSRAPPTSSRSSPSSPSRSSPASTRRLLGIVVNRADPEPLSTRSSRPRGRRSTPRRPDTLAAASVAVWAIPEDPFLVAPTMRADHGGRRRRAVRGRRRPARPRGARRRRRRHVDGERAAAPHRGRGRRHPGRPQRGAARRAHGARVGDVPVDLAASCSNGGFALPEQSSGSSTGSRPACRSSAPTLGTYDTALRITADPRPPRRRVAAQARHGARAVREARRRRTRCSTCSTSRGPSVVTPLMFEYDLLERARRDAQAHRAARGRRRPHPARRRHAARARRRRPHDPRRGDRGARAGDRARPRHLAGDRALEPTTTSCATASPTSTQRRRAHKGVTLEQARDTVHRRLLLRHDDGAARARRRHGLGRGAHDGAHHPARASRSSRPSPASTSCRACSSWRSPTACSSTATAPSCPIPTAEQLADIAISSAATAAQFGIEPRVAMLSYSTGESGSGADVDKVRARDRARARAAPRAAGRGPDPVRRGRRRRGRAHEAARLGRRGPRDGVHLPRPQHGQQHLQGRAALCGRRRDRPGAAGPRKPINDLSRGRPRAGHRQHRRDHGDPGGGCARERRSSSSTPARRRSSTSSSTSRRRAARERARRAHRRADGRAAHTVRHPSSAERCR